MDPRIPLPLDVADLRALPVNVVVHSRLDVVAGGADVVHEHICVVVVAADLALELLPNRLANLARPAIRVCRGAASSSLEGTQPRPGGATYGAGLAHPVGRPVARGKFVVANRAGRARPAKLAGATHR